MSSDPDRSNPKLRPYNRIVTAKGRVLALDLGKKRIGLRRLTIEKNVNLILVGDPLHMSGERSRQGDYTREFAKELEYKTGLPIRFWDERWSSREAERTLRGSGIAHNERKPAIDKLSAVILLQSFLDSGEARQ
jgi:putative holliday junction resolvase